MKAENWLKLDADFYDDDKLIELELTLGKSACYVYMMLIGKLRMAEDYELPTNYRTLAVKVRSTEPEVKSIIEDFDLFLIDRDVGLFTSARLQQDMQIKDAGREERAFKAKKAAVARWASKNDFAEQGHSFGEQPDSSRTEDAVSESDSQILADSSQSMLTDANAMLTACSIDANACSIDANACSTDANAMLTACSSNANAMLTDAKRERESIERESIHQEYSQEGACAEAIKNGSGASVFHSPPRAVQATLSDFQAIEREFEVPLHDFGVLCSSFDAEDRVICQVSPALRGKDTTFSRENHYLSENSSVLEFSQKAKTHEAACGWVLSEFHSPPSEPKTAINALQEAKSTQGIPKYEKQAKNGAMSANEPNSDMFYATEQAQKSENGANLSSFDEKTNNLQAGESEKQALQNEIQTLTKRFPTLQQENTTTKNELALLHSVVDNATSNTQPTTLQPNSIYERYVRQYCYPTDGILEQEIMPFYPRKCTEENKTKYLFRHLGLNDKQMKKLIESVPKYDEYIKQTGTIAVNLYKYLSQGYWDTDWPEQTKQQLEIQARMQARKTTTNSSQINQYGHKMLAKPTSDQQLLGIHEDELFQQLVEQFPNVDSPAQAYLKWNLLSDKHKKHLMNVLPDYINYLKTVGHSGYILANFLTDFHWNKDWKTRTEAEWKRRKERKINE